MWINLYSVELGWFWLSSVTLRWYVPGDWEQINGVWLQYWYMFKLGEYGLEYLDRVLVACRDRMAWTMEIFSPFRRLMFPHPLSSKLE